MKELFSSFSGLFFQNNEPNQKDKDNNYIPLEIINQLKYYVALIEHKNKFNTCFFLNLNINSNSNLYCLCTSSNFISYNDIESKEEYNIHLGVNYLDTISLKLDSKQRRILHFKQVDKFILIQIFPEIDQISKDKFLKIKSNCYNEYLKGNLNDTYIIGYENYFKKDISVSKCKILDIKDNYKIKLGSGENHFLSCSPICIINQNEQQIKNKIQLIGIQGEYDILEESHGFLLDRIINSLTDFKKAPNQLFSNIMNNIIENDINNDIINNITNNYNINNNEDLSNTIGNDNINIDTNINTYEMRMLQYNYFYTFDEYKKHIIKFHNLISKYYVSQNQINFNKHYLELKEYLSRYPSFMASNRKFLDELLFFNDTKNFEDKVPDEMIDNLNKILSSDNLELIDKFSYFIAGLMLALYTYGEVKKCLFINNGDKLYKRVNLNYEDIKRFENNKNNIILFKTFLNNMTTMGHLQGLAYKAKIDACFDKSNNKFDTQIYIIHNFNRDSWKATCFSLNTMFFPEKIINLFSFFKVREIDVNYNEKIAKVTLETIGIKEILEEKIAQYNNKFSLEYNSRENIMEVV